MDVAPFLENGRTYVPLRFIGDAIGVPFDNIDWDNTKRTAILTMSSTTVEFTVGSTSYTVNGQARQMDAAPVLKDGRVFLPARYVAEAFSCSVSWDDKNKTVILTSATNTVDEVIPTKLEAIKAFNSAHQYYDDSYGLVPDDVAQQRMIEGIKKIIIVFPLIGNVVYW